MMAKRIQHMSRHPKKVAARAATFFGVLAFLSLSFLLAPPAALEAQIAATGDRVPVDGIEVRGNLRVEAETIRNALPFQEGDSITIRQIQNGVKAVMALGQFEDVQVRAVGGPGDPVLLVFDVAEHPLVRQVRIPGLEHANPAAVQDSAGLGSNQPYSPASVARARSFIQRALADEGIPFASIEERLEPVEGMDNVVDLVLDVAEGNRVTVAQVEVSGNEALTRDDIVGAMETKPEGFWWFRSGSFEQGRFEQDLTQNIPDLYASRGYLDFQILSDTLIIDPRTGKARLQLEVDEGPQYRIAQFSIEGNQEIEEEELETFFLPQRGGILRTLGIGGGVEQDAEQRGRIFDQVAFGEALGEVSLAYANRGYIWAQIDPVVERSEPEEPGEPHTVSVTVRIQENNPAYIDRIAIEGNDYTHEWVIRDKIFILPGDVYSQQRLIQSYQSIQSLGFFETPMPPPDIQQDPEAGEVDITFRVQEQQTGSVNFGTSVGGGVGLSGFVGYDQPNLFGQAKEGHLRWDFGRYLNNFTLSFSDPALFRSRVSGSISLFNARDRFYQFDTGERRRVGGSVRFGFPIPGAGPRTRFFTGYSLSRTKYRLRSGVDDTSLFGRDPGTQSQATVGVLRQTLNHPIFPTSGSRQEITSELNGGILGGDGDFQKVTAEGQWWVPVAQLGGGGGGRPVEFALGLTLRGGAIFGDASAFPFDQFWMGGVQFGQQLRGYDETTVTPLGFFPENFGGIADVDRLGDAYLSLSAVYAMRISDSISLSTFMDAGNVWRNPGDVDPTQLFRGAGIGFQMVTPFGPIGIDYAYGFDKDVPGWQLHFRMGPGF